MKLKIIKQDNFGSGIAYYQDKIIFIPKSLPDEEIDVEIIKEKTKYYQGKINKIIKKSKKRVKSPCDFFSACDGCHLRMLSYEDTLEYKLNKVKYLFNKDFKYDQEIEIISSKDNYRNKISLKIVNQEIGYYEEESNNLVKINSCNNAKKVINDFISYLDKFKINNGLITIRANYNDELIIIIKSDDKIIIPNLEKFKIVGIILNDQIIYGENHFMEMINNKLFNVSYNSFFQINNEINSKLHNLIESQITKKDVVLDLYCGVGSLSIPAAKNALKVYGIDNLESNIKDALINSKINHLTNIYFLLGDASKTINKIKDKINVVIIDPPRQGLTKEGIENILAIKPNKIFYLSCDLITLIRDLKLFKDYEIQLVKIFDMFPFTYHVESLVILSKK